MAIEELKKVTKWGSSYGIVIPRKFITALGIKQHDLFIIRLTHNKIEFIPYERNDQCHRKS